MYLRLVDGRGYKKRSDMYEEGGLYIGELISGEMRKVRWVGLAGQVSPSWYAKSSWGCALSRAGSGEVLTGVAVSA